VEGLCEHGNEPSGSINNGNFLSSCRTGGFSRNAQLHEVSYVRCIGIRGSAVVMIIVGVEIFKNLHIYSTPK
jgi:hypothetical protein